MDAAALKAHLKSLVDWRLANTIDTKRGGYYEVVGDDTYNHDRKSLVNSCRGVYSVAAGVAVFGGEMVGEEVLSELEDKEHKGWLWDNEGGLEGKMLYGHAFVLLAVSQVKRAGKEPTPSVEAVFNLIEEKFYVPKESCYADYTSADWSTTDSYRGQNGVMHLTEALISAYHATGNTLYLQKAALIATKLCKTLPDAAGTVWVWEHYKSTPDGDWVHDWEYNKADLTDWVDKGQDPTKMGLREYRPWGYLPGHVAEWAKLLLLLDLAERKAGLTPPSWYKTRAKAMLDSIMTHGWDHTHGGLYYCLSPDLAPMNDQKFMWPIAEAFAALRLLPDPVQAENVWSYAVKHFIKGDVWLSRLDRENNRLCVGYNVRDLYHPLAACYDLLQAFGDEGES
eukprot:TRINITY_DN8757_c0_g5_i1.p1 TRINITY_DN8757_c0_g5~~TRINITY_DN8757_c0_g5_i1.p1  ORF type:complete len:409 (+),score=92.64 TRINITY_DN8757_c0_g5_i1:44-1228(+)